ncbi:MAG TPA: sugar ABC transporter substrate-binding protein [Ktedonobacteraceae bacterium]|jgi:multiple sugar transport system substrate-binding protein
MLLLGLAACGGSGSSGTVNLTYALWDSNEQIGYQKSIDEFEKLHPNIKVTIQQADYDQYWQKLDTQLAAGVAPDVFWSDLTYFPHYVAENQIMDVTSLIQQDHLDLSVYYPALLKQYMYQGKYYGLPKDWDTIALFYNKTIFQKMGITPSNDLTWNPTDGGSFLQLLQKLTVDKNGLHPNQSGFNVNSVNQYGIVSANLNQEIYWNYIAMNGGTFMDKPFGTRFEYDQPQDMQALQFLVNLISKWHVSPPASESGSSGDAMTQLFARGKVAMIETGSWNVSYLSKQVNFPFGIIELPTGPKGRISVLNGLSDSIYAKTAHPKEAWELFKWLASPQSQQIVAGMGTVWPGIKSAAPLFASYWKKQGIDVSAFLNEAEGQTVSAPLTPAFNEAESKIDDTFGLMWLGQAPVQQSVTKAMRDANAVLQSGTA